MNLTSYLESRLIKFIFIVFLGMSLTSFSPVTAEENRHDMGASLKDDRNTLTFQTSSNSEQNIPQIERVIIEIFNFSRSDVKFPSILIEGNYAVAEWLNGSLSGRIFLEKNNSNWKIIKVIGKGADLDDLIDIGIPQKEAKILMNYINDTDNQK